MASNDILIEIPTIHQYDLNLPTGCEACATYMMLQWKKPEITLEQVN